MKALGRWLGEHWIAVGSPIVSLLVWEWASASGALREAFFPRPSTVFAPLDHNRDHILRLFIWRKADEPRDRILFAFCHCLSRASFSGNLNTA